MRFCGLQPPRHLTTWPWMRAPPCGAPCLPARRGPAAAPPSAPPAQLASVARERLLHAFLRDEREGGAWGSGAKACWPSQAASTSGHSAHTAHSVDSCKAAARSLQGAPCTSLSRPLCPPRRRPPVAATSGRRAAVTRPISTSLSAPSDTVLAASCFSCSSAASCRQQAGGKQAAVSEGRCIPRWAAPQLFDGKLGRGRLLLLRALRLAEWRRRLRAPRQGRRPAGPPHSLRLPRRVADFWAWVHARWSAPQVPEAQAVELISRVSFSFFLFSSFSS